MNNLRLLISGLTGLSVMVLFRSFIEYFEGVFFHSTSTGKSHIIAILRRYILSLMLIIAVVSAASAEAERLFAEGDQNHVRATWNARVIARYEKLKDNPRPMLPSDVNVLRIGETVICTNQFELFIDYAIQIKARSPAIQTFVVQLANGSRNPEPPPDASEYEKSVWHYASSNTYLPTDRAMEGGVTARMPKALLLDPKAGRCLWKRR